MVQISESVLPQAVADEGNVISRIFSRFLETFKHMGEVRVGQAALAVIRERHAQVVASPLFQRAGMGVRMVIEELYGCLHGTPGLLTDIAVSVQCLADCRNGESAILRYILNGSGQAVSPLCVCSKCLLKRFRHDGSMHFHACQYPF